MGHDQLFKDLLKAFFYDFLVLFTPDLAAAIDPASITFLDPQTFTDLPQGQLRLADLVAEVRTLDGQPELLLVHTEVQSVLDAGFGYRMWEYHALLRLRHQGRLVISIALLPFKDVGEVRLARYAEKIFGQEAGVSIPRLLAGGTKRARRRGLSRCRLGSGPDPGKPDAARQHREGGP